MVFDRRRQKPFFLTRREYEAQRAGCQQQNKAYDMVRWLSLAGTGRISTEEPDRAGPSVSEGKACN